MLSLKCVIRLCRLPLQATFKLVHAGIYLMLHATLYYGIKFNLVQFRHAHEAIYGHLGYYYVR